VLVVLQIRLEDLVRADAGEKQGQGSGCIRFAHRHASQLSSKMAMRPAACANVAMGLSVVLLQKVIAGWCACYAVDVVHSGVWLQHGCTQMATEVCCLEV